MPDLELFAEVALLEDIPTLGLVRGQVGTVVDVHTPAVVEVEFCDRDGRTYAMAPLHAGILIRLHRYPMPGQNSPSTPTNDES